MKSFKFIMLFFFISLFLNSCLLDIPQSPMNDPKEKVSIVRNEKTNNIIEAQLNYDNAIISNNDSLMMPSKSFRHIVHSNTAHLAFTDIIKYNGVWYVSYRFSDGHVPKNFGYVVISESTDLINWKTSQVFMQDGYDLRDPKMYIYKNNLFVHFNSTTISPYGNVRNDYVSKFDSITSNWSTSVLINKNEVLKSWAWRISPINDELFTINYSVPNNVFNLLKSSDGVNYNPTYKFEMPGEDPSEATLREKDSKMYMLARINFKNAKLGIADMSDLTKWEFSTLPLMNIGGPNFLIHGNNLLMGGRLNGKTILAKCNLDKKKYSLIGSTQLIKYDSGYPGMLIEDNLLYFVYYSIVEESESHINLSIIDLNKVL